MQEETLDMKQGERSMISREDNEINERRRCDMNGNFVYCNPTKLYFGEDSLDF